MRYCFMGLAVLLVLLVECSAPSRGSKARRRARMEPEGSPALQGSLPLSSKAHRARAMKSLEACDLR